MMRDKHPSCFRLGDALKHNRGAQLVELLVVFLVPVALLLCFLPLTGGNPLASQAITWFANVLMLVLVWAGLRLRGETWAHFGLSLGRPRLRNSVLFLTKSLLVLLSAVAAFVVGAVVAANIVGIPEGADMSGYNYLEGNLLLLLAALPAVYLVSSFGEEVVYRGFLIHRLAEISPRQPRWWLVVTISGLVFGLAHYTWGIVGMIETSFMGWALGAAYLKLGMNLWIPITAHALMDTILFVQMYLGG